MHVPIFSGCITCKLLIVAHQRQNFACPGLADGAVALMKNGVGVIVKFIHLESSTFPPDWENCRMLRKFIFGKRHLILAHILVY